jgi:DNA-3-methyladenine glycosylase I
VGAPRHGRAGVFERLSLEAFQSGLSWRTILAKRPAFRAAFADFDPDAVAAFGPTTRPGCSRTPASSATA